MHALDAAVRLGSCGAMERRDRVDALGASGLIAFAIILAFNQVVIKLTNAGIQPVFSAGLRSIGALVVLLIWMRLRGIAIHTPRMAIGAGVISGLLFTAEFTGLFWALDHTSVSRASIIFYSMPVHLCIMAHFWLPDERITPMRAAGLGLAMAGVIWVLFDRSAGVRQGQASLIGDLAALAAALGWAGIAMMARRSALSALRPEMQLFWQLAVSSVCLMALAPLFGPLIRDFTPVFLLGLGYQVVLVASMGFLFWFFLLTIYPASGVASFSFLSPVFSVIFGWMVLGEPLSLDVMGALCLVALGIVLINRRPRMPS